MAKVMVRSFSVIEKMERNVEAMQLLKTIAKLVKPIMIKHNWTIPLLAEFYPDQENLLGINCSSGGTTYKICLRLRYPHSPNAFYDLETELLPVMLHELTHCVRGPHDEKFDEILEGLLDEYEALRKAGYTGNGFDADGQRLGGILGGSVEAGRKKALENLEERARKSRILGRGGRLGGSPAPIDPKQAAADAAERRIKSRMKTSCGDENDAATEAAVKKAQKESKIERIDLTNVSDDDDDWLDIINVKKEPAQEKKPMLKKKKETLFLEESDEDSDGLIIVESSFKPPKKVKEKVKKPIKPDETLAPAKKLRKLERKPSEVDVITHWMCQSCSSVTETSYWCCRNCGKLKENWQ